MADAASSEGATASVSNGETASGAPSASGQVSLAADGGVALPVPTASAVAVATGQTRAHPQFSQLSLTVNCARIDSGAGGLLRPNPYVEVVVDGKPPKKTETAKGTYQPKWETELTVVVTPYSKILFRLFDHSAFKRDALLGEHTMDVYTVLKKHQGRLRAVTVSVDLFQTVVQKGGGSSSSGSSSSTNGGTTAVKIGELVLLLDGMSVDLSAVSNVPGKGKI